VPKQFQRLKSKRDIDALFSRNASVFKYPVKILFHEHSHRDTTIYFGVSVSKRNFKRAVDRNLIKRRMRAAVYNVEGSKFVGNNIMLIYVSKEILDYHIIAQSIQKLFTISS
jgi:ribonuclease P protein component